MNIKDFSKYIGNEENCIKLIRDVKERNGIICPKCGHNEHYYNSKYKSHDCKKCRYRITLRSGTVMESSKLPFYYWITAIYFMTLTKKSFSALEIQRILKHKRYEPIWAMMHKIRAAIGQHEKNQILFGNIEFANSTIITLKNNKSKISTSKTEKKKETKISLLINITPPKDPKSKSLRKTAFKKVFAFVTPEELQNKCLIIHETKEKGIFPISGLDTFQTINDKISIIRQYHPESYENGKLYWVRALSSNFRRVVNGIHHNITEHYTQNYLNEFNFKTSTHLNNMFDELLCICMENKWYTNNRYEYG